jgi:large subunit ribosomal protein L25
MSQNVLKSEPRDGALSKGVLNRMRKSGRIPASLYGKDIDTELLFVDLTQFKKMLDDNGQIFEMEAGGTKHMVKTQEIQMRPHESFFVHVAFQKLKKGVQIQVEVPLNLDGKAVGQGEGGVPELTVDKLSVLGNPSDIPESITIDITNLELNGQIQARGIALPPKITLGDEEEKVIVTCTLPKVKEVEPVAAAEEGAEGEAPAEGDASAEKPAEGGSEEKADGGDS